MYSLVSLLSGIYPIPAMHSLLVTLHDKKCQKNGHFGIKEGKEGHEFSHFITYFMNSPYQVIVTKR